MRHDWMFDVLSDLYGYASRNDLPGVASKIEEAMQEMRREGIGGEAERGSLMFGPHRRRVN